MPETDQAIPTYILAQDRLVPAPYQVASLNEAVACEPQGVYTVARTFHGDHVLLFDAHLDRLEQSARLVNIPLHLDRMRLRAALRDLVQRAGYPDSKFRITVPQEQPECVYLALEPYQPVPPIIQQQGAHVITVPMSRHNPVVKTTEWMTLRRSTYDNLPPGVYEGILVTPDGTLLEGLSCNVFSVLDGVLYTAGDGVLEGITRRAILQIAPEILPVKLTAICWADVPHLSEAMLTSSGRGVVPITVIDGQPVGDGKVGPVVTQMLQRYAVWAEMKLEPI